MCTKTSTFAIVVGAKIHSLFKSLIGARSHHISVSWVQFAAPLKSCPCFRPVPETKPCASHSAARWHQRKMKKY